MISYVLDRIIMEGLTHSPAPTKRCLYILRKTMDDTDLELVNQMVFNHFKYVLDVNGGPKGYLSLAFPGAFQALERDFNAFDCPELHEESSFHFSRNFMSIRETIVEEMKEELERPAKTLEEVLQYNWQIFYVFWEKNDIRQEEIIRFNLADEIERQMSV